MKSKKVDVENHQQQIEIAKKQWLEPLTKLIAKISRSFSEYFHSMDCAGEVDLKLPDNAVSIAFIFPLISTILMYNILFKNLFSSILFSNPSLLGKVLNIMLYT